MPTASPCALRRVQGLFWKSSSKNGVFARVIALPLKSFPWPKPSSTQSRTLFFAFMVFMDFIVSEVYGNRNGEWLWVCGFVA